jgi:hypothetical protein
MATRVGLEGSEPGEGEVYVSFRLVFLVHPFFFSNGGGRGLGGLDEPSHFDSSSGVIGSSFGGARLTGVLGAKFLGSSTWPWSAIMGWNGTSSWGGEVSKVYCVCKRLTMRNGCG